MITIAENEPLDEVTTAVPLSLAANWPAMDTVIAAFGKKPVPDTPSRPPGEPVVDESARDGTGGRVGVAVGVNGVVGVAVGVDVVAGDPFAVPTAWIIETGTAAGFIAAMLAGAVRDTTSATDASARAGMPTTSNRKVTRMRDSRRTITSLDPIFFTGGTRYRSLWCPATRITTSVILAAAHDIPMTAA
jgi:hypothetical protein